MKYHIVTQEATQKVEGDTNSLITDAKAMGYNLTGFHASPYTRKELEGQPKFSGLCGPMWDGDAIRYEDVQTYNILSA